MILNLFATPSALPWNHGKDALVRTPYFRSAEDCDGGGEGGEVWEGAKKVPGAKHRYDSAYTNLKPMQLSHPCLNNPPQSKINFHSLEVHRQRRSWRPKNLKIAIEPRQVN